MEDPVFGEAIASGRLRVTHPSTDVYMGAIDEIKRFRRAGAESVGVFLMKRQMVDEFAERLTAVGIRHEIAGLQDSAGEAELAIATLARFAAGRAEWRTALERIAVFLYDSRRGRDNLPQLLVDDPEALPARPLQRLAALREAMPAFKDRSVEEFLVAARPAWSGLLLGGSLTLWEMGADDLRGQSLGIRGHALSVGGADELYEIAVARRTGAVTQMITGQLAPVRLMTRPQAKGREMDAVVIVNHPDDFERDESLNNDRRVLFVMVTRARQSVSLVLRPDPPSLLAPFARLAPASLDGS
jgi:superfamily I DNA/RNA helicase